MIQGNVIHAYLVLKATATTKQLRGIASLIEENAGKCTSVIDSTHCINKAVLCCSENNYVNYISEEVVSLDGQIKISVDTLLHRPSVKI
jgi:hypothetical protein